MGHLGYFLTISMFSWMTVLSFDIFYTFSYARSGLKIKCHKIR